MLLKMIYKRLIISFLLFIICFTLTLFNNDKYKETLEYVSTDVKTSEVYLLDKNNYLSKVDIMVESKNKESLVKEILNILIIDGIYQDKIPNGFKAVIPVGTEINNITIDKDLVKINFGKQLEDISDDTKEQIIESVIYSITKIEGINKIMLFIDGKIIDKVNGTYLSSTLDKNYGINKVYDFVNLNDIDKTIIYFINEYNNNFYYVPITKYSNDNRNKIEIIVDELTGVNLIDQNLMSFINTKTKLLNYELKNDEIILNFNKYLYSDEVERKILDEISDIISLSCFANFDIKEVKINIENKEIFKKVLSN